MDKLKYRYNWKTGKPERLFRVEMKSDVDLQLEYHKNRLYVQRLMSGTIH